jgi:hypothetical protein
MIPTGFDALAEPTARAAPGQPMASAISPYDAVSPTGILRNACHTRC